MKYLQIIVQSQLIFSVYEIMDLGSKVYVKSAIIPQLGGNLAGEYLAFTNKFLGFQEHMFIVKMS